MDANVKVSNLTYLYKYMISIYSQLNMDKKGKC